MKANNKFHGPFAVYLSNLLAEKRKLGIKYKEEERLMHVFDKLSCNFDCTDGLTKDLVMAYVERRPHWSQKTQECRAYLVKRIAIFLNHYNISAYIYDCKGITKIQSTFKPYIFTYKQITGIFNSVDNNLRSKENDRARLFYPVIFRMLYGCGLRISEALNLTMKDVNLSEGLLHILNSKNHKDRIIPMDKSLTEYCVKYTAQIHVTYNKDDYFFKSPRGSKYDKGSVYHFFRKVLWSCGISHGGRTKGGPRLHDLRHTFCIHSLCHFMERGINHKVALPILSAYMGHAKISETAKYLRITAEIYPKITNLMEETFGHIIPEVKVVKDETD